MDRVAAEDGILTLIQQSSLNSYLATLEISDGAKQVVSEDGQLLVVAPAVIIAPGPIQYSGSDIYGLTNASEIFISVLLAAMSYRSPTARLHGVTDVDMTDPQTPITWHDWGVYEMAQVVRDALRGKNAYSTQADPANRIFLVREEPGPWVQGGVLYTITVKVRGQLQPI